jgi:SAM-dependent methyltransferase
MTEKDREKWNSRYLEKDQVSPPCPLVRRFCRLSGPGRALDLAAGSGGNALFLAGKGFQVEAVDVSDVAVKRLSALHPRITAQCRDLDIWDIPRGRYDLILNIRFLNRRLFPSIIEGLTDKGVLIFKSYLMGGAPKGTKGPVCRDYLLRPNELLHAFLPLSIIYYREEIRRSATDKGRSASLVAIK